MTPLRVGLADDSELFRRGLELLLRAAGVDVAFSVDRPQALISELDRISLPDRHEPLPDVVVIDVRMPPGYGREGIDLAGRLHDQHPGLGICVLSTYLEPTWALDLLDDVPEAIGYLLKDRVADVRVLLEALHRIASGGIALDPDVVSAMVTARRHESRLARLTERELQVLGLLAEGRSNAGIAERLVLSNRTVENHVASVFRALDLADDESGNRRVRATLAYLAAGPAHR